MEIKTDIERKTGPEEGPCGPLLLWPAFPLAGLPASSPAAASSPQKARPPAQGSLVLACVSSSLHDLPDEDPLVCFSVISGDGEQGRDEERESGRVFFYT